MVGGGSGDGGGCGDGGCGGGGCDGGGGGGGGVSTLTLNSRWYGSGFLTDLVTCGIPPTRNLAFLPLKRNDDECNENMVECVMNHTSIWSLIRQQWWKHLV